MNTGVSASVGFRFFSDAVGDLVELTLGNTTDPAIGSALTAVGLEWPDDPAVLPVFAAGGTSTYFDEITYDVRVRPVWMGAPGGYDILISSDGHFEGGGPQGAPRAGESQTVRLRLGLTGYSALELEDRFDQFYAEAKDFHAIARFQAVGPGGDLSDKVVSPEPATVLMLCAGLMLAARPARRRGS